MVEPNAGTMQGRDTNLEHEHYRMTAPIPVRVRLERIAAALVLASGCGGDGSSPTKPSDPSALSLTIAAGDAQQGTKGFALPESLRVRVAVPDGSPASNVSVSFSATAGVLNPVSVVTDVNGLAAAQWIVNSASAGATASITPSKSVTFTARAADPVACTLGPGNGAYNEAPTDYSTFVKPDGNVKAIMLLADFSDLPATETPDAAASAFLPEASDFFTETSYGRMHLDVTVLRRWLRMPSPAAQYAYNPRSGGDPCLFVRDAIAAADPDVDFSQFSLVYFVPALGADIFTVALSPLNVTVISADATRLRHLTILGRDFRFPGDDPNTARYGMAHETSHQFGLPDLYAAVPTTSSFEFVGFWDVMSLHTTGAHYTAWQKQKLGWLRPDEMVCIAGGGLEATLQPIETAGGLKSVALRLSPTRAIVAEVRRHIGRDAGIGEEGVLVYSVDASVASGAGPIRVLPSTTVVDPGTQGQLGPLYNATFGLVAGKSHHFEDAAAGVTIDVVAEEAPSFRIRIKKRP